MSNLYIDPALEPLLDSYPQRPELSLDTLAQFRQCSVEVPVQATFPTATPPERHQIQGPGGALDIYQFTPSTVSDVTPALLWLHGGGYIMGHGEDLWFGALFAEQANVRVFSVDYRLAPEHPFPAARDDTFAALRWLSTESRHLQILPDRIAIGGASAGAGLAASVALFNRGQAGPPLVFQLLLYPMLDHLHDTPSGNMQVPTWSRDTSLSAWDMYLGGAQPASTSVPAIETNLSELPPAFLSIGEADLFLDETRNYAERLTAAGVKAELKTYPGVYHSAEKHGYHTTVGRQMTDDYVAALLAAVK